MSVHNLDVCNWAVANTRTRGGFRRQSALYQRTAGRNTMDGYSLTYDYPGGVKLSYTQVFFHPSKMPGGGQYINVYGEKGAVELMSGTFYPHDRNAQPVKLADDVKNTATAHQERFFEAIRTGSKSPADIAVGCSGALTAIMGREAIYQKRVTTWKEMGVDIAKA